jgi:hypothetical protein
MKITKHLDDELKEEREFTTLDELLKIRFVKEFSDTDTFERFSYHPLSQHKTFLMSEHCKGLRWWVVGTISDFNNKDLKLPEWHNARARR